MLHETARNSKPDDKADWPFHLTVVIGDYRDIPNRNIVVVAGCRAYRNLCSPTIGRN